MTKNISTFDVQELIDKNLIDQAIMIAKKRETRQLRDHDIHVKWADILEELGLFEDAILELNLSIRDEPDKLETYPRLAEMFLDQGLGHRAVKVWKALIAKEPHVPSHYERLGETYKEEKDFIKALEIFQQGLTKTEDPRFKNLIKELDFIRESDLNNKTDLELQVQDSDQINPRTQDSVVFIGLFSSREGVYARQWVSPTGESGYTPIKEPFTIKVAENHLLGNYTVGGYPVRIDNTVNYIVFDIDIAKFAVNKAITSERAWSKLIHITHQTCCKILDICSAHEISAYIEDSGFKGRHCWVFVDSPIQAGIARKFGLMIRDKLLPIPAEVTVEVFPKQSKVKQAGIGNLIKLPLGIHRRTGKRSLFLDPSGIPYSDQLSMLHSIRKTTRKNIYASIQNIQSNQRPKQNVISNGKTSQETIDGTTIDYIAEHHEQYDIDRDPQFQTLLFYCPALKELIDRVNRTANISSNESMVIIHTLGHLSKGPQAVNEIFSRALNADPALLLKSRLKGNPMSCPKIRSRIPDITSSTKCNCSFDLSINLYPSPLIHVRGQDSNSRKTQLGITIDSMQFQQLLQDYVKLCKQQRETKLLIQKYELKLHDFFEESGVEKVQTPMGELRRIKMENGLARFTLDL